MTSFPFLCISLILLWLHVIWYKKEPFGNLQKSAIPRLCNDQSTRTVFEAERSPLTFVIILRLLLLEVHYYPFLLHRKKMNGYIVDTWDYDDDHLFRISAHDDKTPAIQAARLTLPIYISLLHSTCYPGNRPHCWLQQLPFLIEGIMLFHFIQLSYRIPQQPHPPSPSASI